jgi:hypothetical protein
MFSCSMTRANKLLAHLREGSKSSIASKWSDYSDSKQDTWCKEVNLLHFESYEALDTQLATIRAKFLDKLRKTQLIEKIKNRLFELNIQYGINTVLSEIALLKSEKSAISNVIDEIQSKACISSETLKTSVELVKTNAADKLYSYTWRVNAFHIGQLKDRLEIISKELLRLDELKDKLNIENSFSLELTDEEKAMLNLT